MTHHEILSAELPASPDDKIKCSCGRPATVYWPAIRGCKLATWHCPDCLAREKQRLQTALGAQSPL